MTKIPGISLLALLALLFAVVSDAGADSLRPHQAEYKVKISVLSGSLSTRLSADGDSYSANHVVEPKGMSRMIASGKIDEASDFSVAEGVVRTNHYRSSDELTKDKTRADVNFLWDEEKIAGKVDGSDVTFPLDELLHDRVSIQYQLMQDLKSGRIRDEYQLFDIDEIKTLRVSKVGEKRIETSAGDFDAIGIRHQAKNSSRTTTLWCVADLDYLPVLIEQHRKGKLKMRATLKSYTADTSETAVASQRP